jgi:GNAT superfamily N-acetyltransferase
MAATTVQLRVMRPDDIPAGLRLCREANWNQVAADWELFLASSPDGCRVAIDDADKVVGSVATIRYGDDFSWIAMVLVDPPHRGKGIGRQLLKEALDVIGEATTARLDATPAGRAVYVPLGFREEYGLQRMVRLSTVRLKADTTDDGIDVDTNIGTNSGSVRLQPDRVVRPMSDADFADVVKHDRDVFGADRRVLLEMCRREAPEYAWAACDGGIQGYLFGRRGYSFEQMGPLVARDESTARVLAAACLSAHADRAFIIDTPLCAAWIAWLVSAGFTPQRPFTRMHRGDQPLRERVDQMFAIAGPEFG